MHKLRFEYRKLLAPALYTTLVLIVLAGVLLHLKSQPLLDWNGALLAMGVSSGIVTYLLGLIACPLLTLRGLYYLTVMIRDGRKPGVGLISAQFLWNPVNLLVRPSLLNDQGLHARQRLMVSAILFLLILIVMQFVATMLGILYPPT